MAYSSKITNTSSKFISIGIFWLSKDLKDIVISYKQPIYTGERYDVFRLSKYNHTDIWDKVQPKLKVEHDPENYSSLPRGRLTWNDETKTMMVIGGSWVHNKDIQSKLIYEFNLETVNVAFRDEGSDAHYKDFSK